MQIDSFGETKAADVGRRVYLVYPQSNTHWRSALAVLSYLEVTIIRACQVVIVRKRSGELRVLS